MHSYFFGFLLGFMTGLLYLWHLKKCSYQAIQQHNPVLMRSKSRMLIFGGSLILLLGIFPQNSLYFFGGLVTSKLYYLLRELRLSYE